MAKKGKAKRTKPKQRRARGGPPGIQKAVISIAEQACGVTNPFCPEARGARWPDNSYTKSVPWSIPGVSINLDMGAAGTLGFLFTGDIWQRASQTGAATGNSMPFSTLGRAMTLPTGVARYRLTSYGLRITCVAAPLTITGMLRVRLFSPMSGTALTAIDAADMMADATYDIPIASLIGKPLSVIPAPLGDNARFFRDYTAATTQALSSWTNPGWQCCTVALTGAPATTAVLDIQQFYNFEFVFGDGDPSTAFALASPKENVPVQQVNASLFSKIGNFVEGAVAKVDAVFKSKAVATVLPMIANAYGGPMAAGASRAMLRLADAGPEELD